MSKKNQTCLAHGIDARHDLSLEIGPYEDDDEAFLNRWNPWGDRACGQPRSKHDRQLNQSLWVIGVLNNEQGITDAEGKQDICP
jgi:hypothetical protein